MATMKTDSPLSRRIVRAFLGFLDSVEPAPGVDLEGLEVAKECLAEVFKIDPSSVNTSSVNSDGDTALLTNIFSSREASEKQENKSNISHDTLPVDAPSTSFAGNASDVNHSEASQTLGQAGTEEVHTLGISEDELFGQFFGALEKNHYFKLMPDGDDDQVQLDRATHLFHNAVMELKKSRCQMLDRKNLAEIFKSQGNKAMQSKLYPDAIELYTFAIALSEDNAVYYCNRAAAYTQINQYAEAIRDCLKSIEINPNYSKAYSRLGFVYYALGNYRDAINEGFMKALQLDPNNDSVKENIRVAEQKLREEMRRTEHDQGSSSTSHQESNHQQSGGGSRSHAMPPPFTSIPFNTGGLPADIANMVMNMAANVYQGQSSRGRQEAANNADTFAEPEIGISGSMNVNFGEQMMPEDLSGAWRSVMEMFSGVPPPVNQQDNVSQQDNINQQDNVNGGPAPG